MEGKGTTSAIAQTCISKKNPYQHAGIDGVGSGDHVENDSLPMRSDAESDKVVPSYVDSVTCDISKVQLNDLASTTPPSTKCQNCACDIIKRKLSQTETATLIEPSNIVATTGIVELPTTNTHTKTTVTSTPSRSNNKNIDETDGVPNVIVNVTDAITIATAVESVAAAATSLPISSSSSASVDETRPMPVPNVDHPGHQTQNPSNPMSYYRHHSAVNHYRNFPKTQSLDLADERNDVGLKASTSSELPRVYPKGHPFDQTRPIYPNVPYSPYGSPYGSPRTGRRRAPLRESRRISIEQSGSFLQLNQYKLMDQIGQVSFTMQNEYSNGN